MAFTMPNTQITQIKTADNHINCRETDFTCIFDILNKIVNTTFVLNLILTLTHMLELSHVSFLLVVFLKQHAGTSGTSVYTIFEC